MFFSHLWGYGIGWSFRVGYNFKYLYEESNDNKEP